MRRNHQVYIRPKMKQQVAQVGKRGSLTKGPNQRTKILLTLEGVMNIGE